jgi:hypothetical protein
LTKQSISDVSEVLASARAALKALEPALTKYKRIASSDSYAVSSYLMASKGCLQMLITQAEAAVRGQEPRQLDKSEQVVSLSERGAR